MAGRWTTLGYPAALLLLGGVLAVSGASMSRGFSGPLQVDEVLGVAVAVGGLGLLAWWTAALALAVAAEVLRRRGYARAAETVRALTPGFMRRLVSALLGVNLLAAPVLDNAGATAAPTVRPAISAAAATAGLPGSALQPGRGLTAAPFENGGASTPTQAPTPLSLLSTLSAEQPEVTGRQPRVSPEWQPAPVPCGPGLLAREPGRQPEPHGETAAVVVRSGDSLWSIAAARLGPLASDAEIAESWPRWYAVNSSVIGPDPGLLRPGQALRVPVEP